MDEATVFPLLVPRTITKKGGKGVGSNRRQVTGHKQCYIYQWLPTYPFIKL